MDIGICLILLSFTFNKSKDYNPKTYKLLNGTKQILLIMKKRKDLYKDIVIKVNYLKIRII